MGQICLRVVVLNKEEIIMVLHLLVHALLLLLHSSLLHDVVRLSASGATHQDYAFQPGLQIRIQIRSGFKQVSGSGSVFGIRIRIQEGKNDLQK
jgi:hypothetical protein